MAGLAKTVCCSILFVLNVLYPTYNVVIDIIETINSKKMMPPSTSAETKKVVHWLMVTSIVFSALRCVGLILLFFYKCCNLMLDESYNICRKNFECGDVFDYSLLKKIRKHEIADQFICHLMLIENLFQTGIVYLEFVCKPRAWSIFVTDKAFEITCLVDMTILLLLKFSPYLYSHNGSCCKCSQCCENHQCECDYPCTCCRYYLGTLAWIAVVLSIPTIVLLSISISRTEKQCVLMRG